MMACWVDETIRKAGCYSPPIPRGSNPKVTLLALL